MYEHGRQVREPVGENIRADKQQLAVIKIMWTRNTHSYNHTTIDAPD